jgi:hypothetical protein
VAPIPVTVVDAGAGHTWCDLVAEELTRPFDTSIAPMIRVVLLRAGPRTPAAIIVTVDHVIVDGVSAGYILRDLFSALNGHELQAMPVPLSQEELLGCRRAAQPAAALGANSSPPPEQPHWLATASTVRPFDGALPHLSAIAFDEDLTRRLVTRARAERTTVHSALVAAMSRVIFESGRNEFVRKLTPSDFRSHIGVGDDVCLYFTMIRTAFTPEQLTDLWDMARTVGHQLAAARSLPAVLAASAATEQCIPVDATTQEAEDFMVGGAQLRGIRIQPACARHGPARGGATGGDLGAGDPRPDPGRAGLRDLHSQRSTPHRQRKPRAAPELPRPRPRRPRRRLLSPADIDRVATGRLQPPQLPLCDGSRRRHLARAAAAFRRSGAGGNRGIGASRNDTAAPAGNPQGTHM